MRTYLNQILISEFLRVDKCAIVYSQNGKRSNSSSCKGEGQTESSSFDVDDNLLKHTTMESH